jgi:hypothetical protein
LRGMTKSSRLPVWRPARDRARPLANSSMVFARRARHRRGMCRRCARTRYVRPQGCPSAECAAVHPPTASCGRSLGGFMTPPCSDTVVPEVIRRVPIFGARSEVTKSWDADERGKLAERRERLMVEPRPPPKNKTAVIRSFR